MNKINYNTREYKVGFTRGKEYQKKQNESMERTYVSVILRYMDRVSHLSGIVSKSLKLCDDVLDLYNKRKWLTHFEKFIWAITGIWIYLVLEIIYSLIIK